MLNMVSSIDGAATLNGRSGGLTTHSNDHDSASTTTPSGRNVDTQMLVALRREADVLLVGRRTLELEGYRRPTAPLRADGAARPGPRLAIVSASGKVDFDGAAFAPSASEVDPAPLVLCAKQHAAVAREAADGRAEIIEVDPRPTRETARPAVGDELDVTLVLSALSQRGAQVVLCEGGPTLNAHLLAANVVDEINLTVASVVVATAAPRIANGGAHGGLSAFTLAQVAHAHDLLFLRYLHRKETPK